MLNHDKNEINYFSMDMTQNDLKSWMKFDNTACEIIN